MMAKSEANHKVLKADLQISRIITIYHGVQNDWKRPEAYPRYSNGIIYITEGKIDYFLQDETVYSKKGDILVFPKGLVYSGVSHSAINSFFVIDFETIDDFELQHLNLPHIIHSLRHSVHDEFELLTNTWANSSVSSKIRCKSLLYNIISELVDECNPQDSQNTNIIIPALDMMQSEYSNPDFYISDISRQLNLSESQIRRIFKEKLNQSPLQCLQNVRIEHAKNLLLYSADSIYNIAEKCGFNSLYYFCRVFHEKTGKTPSEYRKL